MNDWRREDRFGGRKKPDEESRSPEQVNDLGSASPPIARPVREILGDSVIPLRVIEPPKPQVNQNSDAPPNAQVWLLSLLDFIKKIKYHIFLRMERNNRDIICLSNIQPAASSSSLTTSNKNPPEVKLETAMSLIDFDADPEPPAPSVAIQAPISAAHQPAGPPASATNDNWASFDAAPSAPSLDISQSPPSGNTVDSLLSHLAAPSSVPVQTSTLTSGPAQLGHSTSQIFPPPPNGHLNEQVGHFIAWSQKQLHKDSASEMLCGYDSRVFFVQPWNTGFSSNVQRSVSAPSLHPLQGVPSQVKPFGRTELPAVSIYLSQFFLYNFHIWY